MIQLHAKSGEFYVDLPHDRADVLREQGWKTTRDGSKLFTADPELIFDHVDIFSPELQQALNAYKRVPLKLTEEQWSTLVAEGETLLDHQKATVEFALGSGGAEYTVVGDPPGGGKTAINVTLANYWKPARWLIVCPSSVKYNWRIEINRWSTVEYDEICVIENSTGKEQIKEIKKLLKDNPDARIAVIINYDIIKNFKPFLKKFMKWNMLTYDESHKLKRTTSGRTQFCLGFNNNLPLMADQILFTSATKLNRPFDLWPILRFIEPKRLGADRFAFIERYCGGEWNPFSGTYSTTGKSNVEELGYLMGESFFIRHEIDHLLPPFREETILLPPSLSVMSSEQELFDAILNGPIEGNEEQREIVQKMRFRLRQNLDQLNLQAEDYMGDEEKMRIFGETFMEQSEVLNSIPAFFQLISIIRKKTGLAKIPSLITHIEDLLDRDEDDPLVVMVHHKDVVNALADHFEGRTVKVVGGVSSKKRQEAVESFQSGEKQLFIGNIMAAGEGLTLTRSCRLLFGEIDWTATAMWQALKRVHRITQAREVTIQYLLLQNSLDANLANRYIEKRENIEEFFSGAEIARREREGLLNYENTETETSSD